MSTAALAVLSLIQCGRIDLAKELQSQTTIQQGQKLFQADLTTTSDLRLNKQGTPEHHFIYNKKTGLWNGITPWRDRADGPKAVELAIKFALNAEVVESLSVAKKELPKYGFDQDAISFECRNSLGDIIAEFEVGKASAWHKKIEGKEDIYVPTVYLRRTDEENDKHIYLCTDFTGNIRKLFNTEFKNFRDHRPFALNINKLRQVRLVRSKTEIVLERRAPDASWLLTKPLELKTDPEAVISYLVNLSKLEAIALHSTAQVALPEASEELQKISISNFGSDEETTLTVYPPAENAGSTYATVSNRDVVFELPLIATPKVSNHITQLPDSINSLRSRTMLHLNETDRADLRGIIVRSPTSGSAPVLISRIPKGRYKLLGHNNSKEDIDESVLANLLKQLITTPVKDFASDAAADFSPFGLDQPTVVIDFVFFYGPPIQLRFGKVTQNGPDGIPQDQYFANLRDSPIVWEVTGELISDIPTRSWDWQPKEIWTLPVIDIVGFTAQTEGQPELAITYDYLDDSFTATFGDQDVTQKLNPQRAKFFLNENHHLVAQQRLSPHNAQAQQALENPILTISITVQEFDNEGLPADKTTNTLEIAPATRSENNAFFYAKASNSSGYFILNKDTVAQLAARDIFEED
ncbi:DUF4340 domain-containing protein [Rubritalea spongiae]|uniref:DUF4340 domain-containing protein n=1 Tax=Rubritalea spongiae TaxID=430797 RepID=A0ABW5E3S3_9BACT